MELACPTTFTTAGALIAMVILAIAYVREGRKTRRLQALLCKSQSKKIGVLAEEPPEHQISQL